MEQNGYEVARCWGLPKTQLTSIIADYDALIVRSATKVTAELLSNAKKLRVIGRAGEGLDNIDLKKAREMGIEVVGVDMCVYGRFVTLEEMLPQADFVTVHVPLTPNTRHMLSVKEFAMMKDGVMLVDCSRGGVGDQEGRYGHF